MVPKPYLLWMPRPRGRRRRQVRSAVRVVSQASVVQSHDVCDVMSLKLENFVRTFRGQGDDFSVFWEKFLVVCSLQNLDTEEKRMKAFPLFVEGDAFQIFSQLSDADKKKEDAVKQALTTAFSVSPS